MMQRTVGDTQISCNLRSGFLARLDQLHRFHLKFSRKGSLGLLHGLSLPVSGPLLQVYLPHFSGSRPHLIVPFSHEREFVFSKPQRFV